MARRTICGALAVLATALLHVPAASATFPGATGLQAFQSDRGGDYGIWIANPDASNPRVLYDPKGTHEFNPAWSPNGTQLVVQTGPLDRSSFDLVLVDVLTGDATPLLTGPETDRAAQFCDADTIVFVRRRSPTDSDIYSIRTDGGALTQLTSGPALDSSPTCHPTEGRIAFSSDRDGGQPAIWEIDRDGSNPRKLVPGFAVEADYAPDGSALAYAGTDADGNNEIFTKDLTTGVVTQRTYTSSSISNRQPHFAPDYGGGVVPAGRALQGPPPRIWIFYTEIRSGIPVPEVNAGLVGIPRGAVVLCGNPPAGPPGVGANPPAEDPGGPGNNSGLAAQPGASCELVNGILVVHGTEGPDTVVLTGTGGAVEVTVNGVKHPAYKPGEVKKVVLEGRGGADDFQWTGLDQGEFGSPGHIDVDPEGGSGLTRINGSVAIDGTGGPDRLTVSTTGDRTSIVFNGESATFTDAGVYVDDFDAKDLVVVDVSSFVVLDDVGGADNDAVFDHGTLTLEGGTTSFDRKPVDDTFTIRLPKKGPLRITINGNQLPGIAGTVKKIKIDGKGGEDTIQSNVPVQVTTGNRAPSQPVAAASLFQVRIDAGGGDDRVTCRGQGQRCTVAAGSGDDLIDVRDGTRSVVDGGPGRDTVIADGTDSVRRAEVVRRTGG